MTNTLIAAYLGSGLAAARPATPAVDTGAAGYYYATDTGALSVYAASAWNAVIPPAPTIKQTAVAAGASITGATFGGAPTSGNLLVAIVGGGIPSPGAGWSLDSRGDNGGSTESRVFYKIAGASESATQNPASAGGNYGIAIFELSANATPAGPVYASSTGITTLSVVIPAFKTTGLLIGAAFSDGSTNLPSGITGATGGSTANTSRSVQAFSNAAPAQAVAGDTVTATWASSSNYRLVGMFVG